MKLSDDELREAFPGEQFRKHQFKSLRDISTALETVDDVILSAPCGAGKSFVSVGLANAYAVNSNTSYITTPFVNLARQYEESTGVSCIVGREHYQCHAIQGSCRQRLCDALNLKVGKRTHTCNYVRTYSKLTNERVMCCTLSLLLNQRNAPKRDLLIVDEAHKMGSFVGLEYKTVISGKDVEIPDYDVFTDYQAWMHGLRKPLEEQIKSLEQQFSESFDFDMEVLQKLRHTESMLAKTQIVASSSNTTWVFYREGDVIIFEPVDVRRLIQKDVMRLGAKRVYMSATPPTRAELGLTNENSTLIQVPSTFPKENRAIILDAVGKMNFQHRAENMTAAARKIIYHTQSGHGPKSLIHCGSYVVAKMLSDELSRFGIPHLLQERKNRSSIIDVWKKSGVSILISVNMWEGLDLHDDFCRLIFWVNMPYPDINNPVVKARVAAEGKGWMQSDVARNLVQGCGRGVRHDMDRCRSIILDSGFNYLQYDEAVPAWFRDNIFIVNSGAAPKVVKQKRKQM